MRNYPADVIAGTNGNGHVEAAASAELGELCSICGTRPRHLSWSTCGEQECRTEAKRRRDRAYAQRRRVAAASSPGRSLPAPPRVLAGNGLAGLGGGPIPSGAVPADGIGVVDRLGPIFNALLAGGSATLVTERVLSVEGEVITRISESQIVHLVPASPNIEPRSAP